MKYSRRAAVFTAALMVAALAPAAVRASSPYAAIDLGTLPGSSESNAVAVNASGQVAGNAGGGAASWTADDGWVSLGTLPGKTDALPFAINASGQIVGYSWNPIGGDSLPFSWTQAGGMISLGHLAGDDSGVARDVNDAGQVVGSSDHAGSSVSDPTLHHAFLWTSGGGMVDLGTLGGHESVALAINASGQVTGHSRLAAPGTFGPGDIHSFFWTQAGGMIDIGTLGGPYTFAERINDSGQIVGTSQINDAPDYTEHAFSWTLAGGMKDLGASRSARDVDNNGRVFGHVPAWSWTLGGGIVNLGSPAGGQSSTIAAVNRSGTHAVGQFEIAGDDHALVWTQADGMVDLGTLGGDHSEAVDVNDAGQIVGTAKTAAGKEHAVMWFTPQPEQLSGTFSAGGSATTDSEADGATPFDPIETSVTSPNAGPFSIHEEALASPSGSGYSFLGQQVSITAPAASVANPLVFSFRIDASLLPAGVALANVAIFRNGLAVADCSGSGTSANPNPCIASRVLASGGDAVITVRTSAASLWKFGLPQRKPDGRIRAGASGPYVGNNIYNTNAAGQATTASATPGHSLTFSVSVSNDGTKSDRFTLKATGASSTAFKVTYHAGSTNITSAVVAGTYKTPKLAPGAKYLITATVAVKSTAPAGSKVKRLITIASVGTPAQKDAVKLTGKRT